MEPRGYVDILHMRFEPLVNEDVRLVEFIYPVFYSHAR